MPSLARLLVVFCFAVFASFAQAQPWPAKTIRVVVNFPAGGTTDMMARALKIDPVEFRRKNLAVEGKPHATSQILKDHPVEKVMDKVLERLNWSKPFDKGTGTIRRGRGFAIAIKAVISPTTSVAITNVSADGSVTLYCGTVDMGQGSDTAMAQMVGDILNVPAESVRVVPRDTDVTPYDMGTLGSRSLFHMGHAVRRARDAGPFHRRCAAPAHHQAVARARVSAGTGRREDGGQARVAGLRGREAQRLLRRRADFHAAPPHELSDAPNSTASCTAATAAPRSIRSHAGIRQVGDGPRRRRRAYSK